MNTPRSWSALDRRVQPAWTPPTHATAPVEVRGTGCRSGEVPGQGGQWAFLLAHYRFMSLLPALLLLVNGLRFRLAGNSSWRQQILDTADADVLFLAGSSGPTSPR